MNYVLVMTTYNSSGYIRSTLTSILKNLQKDPPDQVLIFDDASLDDTKEEVSFVSSSSKIPISFFSSKQHKGAKENIAVALLSGLKQSRYVLYCQDDIFAFDDKELFQVVKMNQDNSKVAITCPYTVIEQEMNYQEKLYHIRKVIGGQRTLVSAKHIPLDLQFWFLYEVKETKDYVKGFLSNSLGSFFQVGLAHRFCFCVDRNFVNGTKMKIEEAIHHKSMLDDWFLQIKFKNQGKIWIIPPVAVGHLKNTELFYSPDYKLFEDYWQQKNIEKLIEEAKKQGKFASEPKARVQVLKRDSFL